VRLEPLLENMSGKRLLALRVMQIVEPIKYAATFSREDTVTEGLLLYHPRNGKILTVNVDLPKYSALGLLWPDQDTMLVTLYGCVDVHLTKFLHRARIPTPIQYNHHQ
jgi:hypothetical protein